jgi:hypothetical protein
MARLYVQEHGNELLEFMRQNEILHLEENEEEQQGDMWAVDEHQAIAEGEEDRDGLSQSGWSLKAILQWIWGKITLQEAPVSGDYASPLDTGSRVDPEMENGSVLPAALIHSTVAVAMIMIVAVVLSRSK